MKAKIKDLNANPFKKQIGDGELNEVQVKSLRANIKELGLMGAIPCVKKESKLYLVAGHHRLEALRQEYGDDYEVEITVHPYTEEQMFRGMVVENLTQRKGDFQQEQAHVVAIRKMLEEHKDWQPSVQSRTDGGKFKKGSKNLSHGIGATRIVEWLKTNDNCIISKGKVNQLLSAQNIADKKMLKKVDKEIKIATAQMLSKFKHKKEQEDIFKALTNSKQQNVKEQAKTVTLYKTAPNKIKEKIRDGTIDIADVGEEILNEKIKGTFYPYLLDKMLKMGDLVKELNTRFIKESFKENFNKLDDDQKEMLNISSKNLNSIVNGWIAKTNYAPKLLTQEEKAKVIEISKEEMAIA